MLPRPSRKMGSIHPRPPPPNNSPPSAGPWDAGRCSPRWPRRPSASCSGRSWPASAFHPPGLVARMAAAIDEISGGRFVLGVGSGWNEEEFRAFGLPFDHRAVGFIESFEIIRRLLAGEHVTSEGTLLAGRRRRSASPAGAHDADHARHERPAAARRDPAPRAQLEHAGGTPTATRAEGFVARNAEISAAAEHAGRDPAEVERSACVLVALDPAAGERPRADVPPLTGAPQQIARAPARPRRGRRRRGDPRARPDHRGQRAAVRRRARGTRRL